MNQIGELFCDNRPFPFFSFMIFILGFPQYFFLCSEKKCMFAV